MKRFTPFHALLLVTGLLLAAGLVYSIRGAFVDYGHDPRHAEETGRAMIEADRASGAAQREFQARRYREADAKARTGLDEARALLASCESRPANDPARPDDLVAAALAFSRWLELHQGDVEVLLLRARAWELRRFGDKAAADFRRAIDLKPALAGELRERLDRAVAGYPAAKP